jgi:hypothetical protein
MYTLAREVSGPSPGAGPLPFPLKDAAMDCPGPPTSPGAPATTYAVASGSSVRERLSSKKCS